jgi:hypothetical protein
MQLGVLRRSGRGVASAAVGLGLTLAAPPAASIQVVNDPGTVIQTIDTSLWNPPSPDPHGITYLPTTGQLITCDAEVEEMPSLYAGANLWLHGSTGVVTGTLTTTPLNNEPTGIGADPAGGRLWISNDDLGRIFEIRFGPDGAFGTADDTIVQIRGLVAAGCDDLEDVTYNNLNGNLYVASGAGVEVCEVDPGANGVFDGAPPHGDDIVTTFDVGIHGLQDPEGIVYDPFWNTFVVADRRKRDLFEFTAGIDLLRRINVNLTGSTKISGVTIAPSSINPALRSYWVTDRRVDNQTDPFENDGLLYEIVAIPLGGNGRPFVDAGPPQTLQWPTNTASLAGFVNDDGHPYPPSVVLSLWAKLSGPGSVSFGNTGAPNTTATFSAPGEYVLQLVGDDSDLQTADTVTITVQNTFTLSLVTVGPGTVSVSPPGAVHPVGSEVVLTAKPNVGALFKGWSGDLGGATNLATLVMSSDRMVQADFAPRPGGGGCGIGPELAIALPLLAWLQRRRRRKG